MKVNSATEVNMKDDKRKKHRLEKGWGSDFRNRNMDDCVYHTHISTGVRTS
jgi:hypothetical protein